MKGCVQWNSAYGDGGGGFQLKQDQTRSARSVGQLLTH